MHQQQQQVTCCHPKLMYVWVRLNYAVNLWWHLTKVEIQLYAMDHKSQIQTIVCPGVECYIDWLGHPPQCKFQPIIHFEQPTLWMIERTTERMAFMVQNALRPLIRDIALAHLVFWWNGRLILVFFHWVGKMCGGILSLLLSKDFRPILYFISSKTAYYWASAKFSTCCEYNC